jgi:hypothetical protein
MDTDYVKWLEEANKKFESCEYAFFSGTFCKCFLDGCPVLDCPGCNSYKEKPKKED